MVDDQPGQSELHVNEEEHERVARLERELHQALDVIEKRFVGLKPFLYEDRSGGKEPAPSVANVIDSVRKLDGWHSLDNPKYPDYIRAELPSGDSVTVAPHADKRSQGLHLSYHLKGRDSDPSPQQVASMTASCNFDYPSYLTIDTFGGHDIRYTYDNSSNN
jgi:hypothetical protein